MHTIKEGAKFVEGVLLKAATQSLLCSGEQHSLGHGSSLQLWLVAPSHSAPPNSGSAHCGVGHNSQLERATLACGVGLDSQLERATGRTRLGTAAASYGAVAPVAPDAVNYLKSKARVTNIKKEGTSY